MASIRNRIAILDLGTNTFHLLIAEADNNQHPKIIFQRQEHPKLGEGGMGYITPSAFECSLNILKSFKNDIDHFDVKYIKTVGTAAIREAKNGVDFIHRVKTETGFLIEKIDGVMEAELIYLGVKRAIDIHSECLIMDIGGGSVEFILCNEKGMIWAQSYPIGVARLEILFHHHDPITQQEIKALNTYLDKQLVDLKALCQKHKPKILIGSAGAFDTFAALVVRSGFANVTSLTDTDFFIKPDWFKLISADLLRTTHQERAAIKEIIAVRTDMIILATLLVNYILHEITTTFNSIRRSAFALKEGLLYHYMNITVVN